MIKDKQDLKRYLRADRDALRRPDKGLQAWLFDEVWRYQRRLRWSEYYLNTGRRVRALGAQYLVLRLGNKLGLSVAPNVFGEGLSIAHTGMLSVNEHARVGRNCRVSAGVTIGAALDVSSDAPTIGDDCFIGPGAAILGAITLGDRARIGANAVVTRSYPEAGLTLVGIPARPLPPKSEDPA